jgi:uncharacterized Zn-finger protein
MSIFYNIPRIFVESFVDCRFEETLFTSPQSSAEICEDCQKALEEYDSICLRAAKIQEQISESFKRSQEQIQLNSKDELNCKICCAVFSSKKDMVDHDCTEDFAIEYVAFSDEDSNVKSITKLNAFKYTCNQCQEQFLRKSEYQIHMRIAHLPDDAEIFSCSLCPNAFISEVSLKLHFNLVHQANCTAFECPVCEKTFSTKNLLNRHFGIHNAQTERPHVCEICGKTYYHRSSFIEHTKCHSDQRDFACQYCHKTFRSISHLNRHKKIHTKQKNFECESE